MSNYILSPVVELKGFIVLSVAAVLLTAAVVSVMLARKKRGLCCFGLQGLFFGRSVGELWHLSMGILEVVYVTSMFLFPVSIGRTQFLLLAALCLLRGITGLSVQGFLAEVLFGMMEGAALAAGSLLLEYMWETGFDWYIMAVRICLAVFLIQYSIYHLIKGVERMLRKDEANRHKMDS